MKKKSYLPGVWYLNTTPTPMHGIPEFTDCRYRAHFQAYANQCDVLEQEED